MRLTSQILHKHTIPLRFFIVFLLISLSCCIPFPSQATPAVQKPGQIAELEDQYGIYYTYIPETITDDPKIVALVHGTPVIAETAEATAQYYAKNWIGFAEQHGCVLIVPAFNQEDFSSRRGHHAMTGYRGLFGREIAADEWVLR